MEQKSYTRQQLIQGASLTQADMAEIRRCRRDSNRLGFAYQIGFVRLLNRFPMQQPFEVLEELLTFISVQVNFPPPLLAAYLRRQQTISEHQQRIMDYLHLRRPGSAEVALMEQFLFEASCRLEQTTALFAQVEAFLKEQGILRPADSTLSRIIGTQSRRAQEHIFQKIAVSLPAELSHALDALLQVKPDETASALHRIKVNPSKASAESMLSLLDKLALIEAAGILGVDLSWLNSNFQRSLFHYVRKCPADRLREVAQPRRNAALICFLWQSYRDAIDQAVDMFDKLLIRIHAQAQNAMDDQMRQQRRMIQASLSTLKSLCDLILDESIADEQLRQELFREVPRPQLVAHVENLSEWVSGKRSDLFYEVITHFGYLRRFIPAFLRALEFVQETEGEDLPCLIALRTLKDLNDQNQRKLPEDACRDFIPLRLRSIVENGGKLDRRAWECALLVAVRDEIKSGNLSVRHSKRFGRFDDFFMEGQQWQETREAFFRHSGLPANADDVPDYLRLRLGQAYDRFLATAPQNSFATLDENGWRLSVDPAEKLDPQIAQRLDHMKAWLARHMRQIKLPDLLIEVDNELGFTRHFMAAAQQQERGAEEVCLILAAVMAHGCNIGPYTMAQLTQGITYDQLKRVSDWQLTQEAQKNALAKLVNAIAGLDASLNWGEGKTSASDGQRFSLPRKVLQQTYSPRFSDFALEFYSFIADNYAPFYSTPIECTDRDAAFVLDGLLYNESELELEEHYTDTHGYTEINFAAFAMLGRTFCPRIRGLQHQRIYRIDPDRDDGALTPLVSRADRTLNTRLIAQQWDRMGQFYASMQCGHTTASVALKRLAAYTAKNRFYQANRDLGRIFKTEFILSYLSQPQLRTRIRRGLLKVEQLHALARDVYYGRRGRIHARELHEQINACSCLTLVLACIIYWQAKETSRISRHCESEANGVDLSLLEYVSPIEWDNIILYGEYVLDRKLIR